jgi:hypothetical protein
MFFYRKEEHEKFQLLRNLKILTILKIYHTKFVNGYNVYLNSNWVIKITGIWPMDLNFPVFATGVRIFRASNDVGS